MSVALAVCFGRQRSCCFARVVFISTGFLTEWIHATCSGMSGSRVAISALASTTGLGTEIEYHPSASAMSLIVSVPHGVANAIHLPHVIRFNARGGSDIANRYRDISELFGVESGGSDDAVGDALAGYVTDLVGRLGLPTRLSQAGVPEDGIPALVEGAMGDGTTLLNPREMAEEDYAELYRAAL